MKTCPTLKYRECAPQKNHQDRRSILALSIILFIFIFLWGCAGTYPPGQGPMDLKRGLPVFDHEIIRLLSEDPDLTDVLVLVQIPYDNLQFVRDQDTFKANYEVMVVVTDSTGMVITDHFSTFSVEEANYYQTNSQNIFARARVPLSLPEGAYDVLVEVTDLESKGRSRVASTASIDSKSGPCRLSDIILAKPGKDESDPRSFTPIVGSFLYMGEKDVFLYYEAAFNSIEPVEVQWQFIRLPPTP